MVVFIRNVALPRGGSNRNPNDESKIIEVYRTMIGI